MVVTEERGAHPPNYGLEQTAHRLRQGMRHLEQEARLRRRLARAAQAECYPDACRDAATAVAKLYVIGV